MSKNTSVFYAAMAFLISIAAVINPDRPFAPGIPYVLGDSATAVSMLFMIIGIGFVWHFIRGDKS